MRIIAGIVIAVLLASACGDKDSPNITMDAGDVGVGTEVVDQKAECTPQCEGKECGDDGCGGQCGECALLMEECSEEGQCVPFSCQSSKDCPGDLVCAEDLGQCVVCVGDEDCPGDKTCGADHECHTELTCKSDKDCKDYDMICDKDGGVCVACLDSDDCDSDQYCLESYCIDDVCTAGETYCDGVDVVACNEEGSAEGITETCTDTQYCEDGECHTQICPPGSLYCEDNLLHTCDPVSKEVIDTVDCETDDKVCYQGECVEQNCEPNSTWCQDYFTAAVCSDDGMSSTVAPCDTDFYCDEGACKPQVCEPNAVFCDDEVAKVCNGNGSAVASEEDCAAKQQHCFAGSCIDTVCQPNLEFCHDDITKAVCAADGMSSTPEACPVEHYCVEGDATVQCLPWFCTPGAAFCEDNAAKVCNSKGSTIINEIACGDSVCVGGACKPVICDANTSSCDGNTVMQCDATGTVEQELEVCGEDQYCQNAQCKDQACEPGQKACDGSKVMQCNAIGSDSAEDKDCADDQQGCKDGECVDQICTPNATYCDGNVVKKCNSDGTSSSVVETCGNDQYCGEDGNAAACADQVCVPNAKACEGTKVMECDDVGAALEELKDCADDGEGCSGGVCVEQVCGNGVVDDGEECDDGNQLMCDGCEGCEELHGLALTSPTSLACTSVDGQFHETWTVEAWVRFDDLANTSVARLIIAKIGNYPSIGDSEKNTLVLRVQSKKVAGVPGGDSSLRFLGWYEDASDKDYFVFSQTVVQALTWYHVAYERTAAGEQKLYVDGVLEDSSPPDAAPAAAPGPYCVGSYEDYEAASIGLQGIVDEIRVSNVVRYADTFVPARQHHADEHTVALWHFDEGEGSTAIDSSNNGFDLTLEQGAAWTTDDCYGSSPDSAICGDGKKAVWEQCDDGNVEDGDGCSGECQLEGPETDCMAIHQSNPAASSGTYEIDPDGPNFGAEPFLAYCDMTTAGGGWTLVWKQTGHQSAIFAYKAELKSSSMLLSEAFNGTTQGSLVPLFDYSEMLFKHSEEVWIRLEDKLEQFPVKPIDTSFNCRKLSNVPHECLGVDCKEYRHILANDGPVLNPKVSGFTVGAYYSEESGPECGGVCCSNEKHGRYDGVCASGPKGIGDWMLFVR